MLVLTRKSEEEIIIVSGDEKIVLTVLRVQGDKVSLGFKASPEIAICRKEVYTKQQMAEEEKLATASL